MTKLESLTNQLIEAGLPITGIRGSDNEVELFESEKSKLTKEQLILADTVISAFDWSDQAQADRTPLDPKLATLVDSLNEMRVQVGLPVLEDATVKQSVNP